MIPPLSATKQLPNIPNLVADQAACFELEIRPVLEQVRIAVAAVVEGVQPSVRRVSELQAVLGIDHHLSWSVFTAAHVSNPLLIASLLPGERAMKKFLDKASARGVAKAVISRASIAIEAFEAMVQKHAGSREVFESMVVGLTPEEVDPANDLDLKNKRSAFRANALLWGQQARQNNTYVLAHPSKTLGLVDNVQLFGVVGWHQTRRGTVLPLAMHSNREARPGDPSAPSDIQPLETSDTDKQSTGILQRFSSQPLPAFRSVVDGNGKVTLECTGQQLGITGEITYFAGHVWRGSGTAETTDNEKQFGIRRTYAIPSELSVCDVLMHESLWDERLPEVGVYGAAPMGVTEARESDRLPLREKAVYLGKGVDCARSPELPRHTELLHFAVEKMGWDPSAFRVFRLRVEYPILYSRISMIFRK